MRLSTKITFNSFPIMFPPTATSTVDITLRVMWFHHAERDVYDGWSRHTECAYYFASALPAAFALASSKSNINKVCSSSLGL